jgi:hypothetical protein
MGKALALIFTGCGIMLLLNFFIFFLVDNVRKNRNRNRGSIIRKRLNRRKSVSFANPLVNQTVPNKGQSYPSPGEEIEMVDLGPSRGQSTPPPPAPTPLPLRPNSTIPPQPMRPAPILNLTKPAKQPVLKPTRAAPPLISTKPTTKINFPTFPPPMPPLPMDRSMSTRQPHRYSFYKTFTIILF